MSNERTDLVATLRWDQCDEGCKQQMRDKKALHFSLDEAGIASRERDAAELVELRAKLAMAKSASKKYVYSTNGVIDRAEARIAELEAERGETRKENEWLRAYTGQSAKACVYCGLGADEQAQCERGFPGCARADDQMLCREVGVALERDALRAENEALRSQIYDIRAYAERGRYDLSALPSDPPQNAVVSEIIAAIDAAKERTP